MELGVYSRSDGSGPLVLVALCLRPSIEAEHLYGQLHFQGAVDTDELALGIDWAVLLAAILDASYATVDREEAHLVIAVMDADARQQDAPGKKR